MPFKDTLPKKPITPHQSTDFPEQNVFYFPSLLNGPVSNNPCGCIPPFVRFAPVVSEEHLQISLAFVLFATDPCHHCALMESGTFQPSSPIFFSFYLVQQSISLIEWWLCDWTVTEIKLWCETSQVRSQCTNMYGFKAFRGAEIWFLYLILSTLGYIYGF